MRKTKWKARDITTAEVLAFIAKRQKQGPGNGKINRELATRVARATQPAVTYDKFRTHQRAVRAYSAPASRFCVSCRRLGAETDRGSGYAGKEGIGRVGLEAAPIKGSVFQRRLRPWHDPSDVCVLAPRPVARFFDALGTAGGLLILILSSLQLLAPFIHRWTSAVGHVESPLLARAMARVHRTARWLHDNCGRVLLITIQRRWCARAGKHLLSRSGSRRRVARSYACIERW
jgi:hypothetical protein